MFRMSHTLLLVSSILLGANAHGDHAHDQTPIPADADWQTRHMLGKLPVKQLAIAEANVQIKEEHHIQGYDSGTLFTLHDFDNTGAWSPEDIRRMYGFYHESTDHVSDSDKASAIERVLSLFDADRSGTISYAEFTVANAKGITLPDFGYGPGHHGDLEQEYELHHWEKYHSGDDVKEEDLNHPEDIEHFRKHDEEERIQEEWDKIATSGNVIEKNIPKKFLRVKEDL